MDTWSAHAVVLPGTGSDAQFAADAFAGPLAASGIVAIAVQPDPTAVVASYVDALDRASSEHGPIVAAGISLGAAVAAAYALDHPDRVRVVLAALPPWLGPAGDAPAAVSARFTAERLTSAGLDAVLAEMTSSTPSWLSTALHRSWTAQWPNLVEALDEAARYTAPRRDDLRRLRVPVAVVGAADDPVHPFAIAEIWNEAIPRSAMTTVSLDEIGADPAVLGRSALAALATLSH